MLHLMLNLPHLPQTFEEKKNFIMSILYESVQSLLDNRFMK